MIYIHIIFDQQMPCRVALAALYAMQFALTCISQQDTAVQVILPSLTMGRMFPSTAVLDAVPVDWLHYGGAPRSLRLPFSSPSVGRGIL